MIGRKLSHFRIVSRLGKGGMGVVYKAEDENLKRTVALKVLPPERLGNEESRLRIVREARVAAAISHPNIAVVHEIDEEDGVVFVAMELIEGKTLGATIGGSPLPIDEALRLGAEIADGLAAAHQARVIHRDLKPENIIVTSDRRVKILDFGLAKVLEPDSRASTGEPSRLTTISDEMTQAGRVMGTTPYMSPEQVRGQSADARSDLFAFGIVLYEMVTGKRPFRGETPMDVMTAILREDAAASSTLNAEVPPELDRIVAKCLEKDASDRYQDARDLVVDLKRLKRDSESQPLARQVTAPMAAEGGQRRAWFKAAVSVGLASALAAGGFAAWRFWPHAAKTGPRNERLILSSEELGLVLATLSPDGRSVAFTSTDGLFVREIATGAGRQLLLPEGEIAEGAAWSPDGSLIYTRGRISGRHGDAIWTVSVLTGGARNIHADVSRGPWPSPDGRFLAFLPSGLGERELWLMSVDGTSPRRVLAVPGGESIRWVAWAPNSGWLAFQRERPIEQHFPEEAIEICDTEGRQRSVLVSDSRLWSELGGNGLAWLPDGRVLFSMAEPSDQSSTNVWSLRVDPDSGHAVGTPTSITTGLGATNTVRSVSSDGKRVLLYRCPSRIQTFVGSLSADGSRLSDVHRLSHSSANTGPTGWTHDGQVLLHSDRNGPDGIFMQELDKREPTTVLGAIENYSGGPWANPDGTEAFYAIKGPDERQKDVSVVMSVSLRTHATRTLGTFKSGIGIDYPLRNGSPWVISEKGENEITLHLSDEHLAKGREFARIRTQAGENPFRFMSPDGSRFGVFFFGQKIDIVDVPGGQIHEILPKGIDSYGSATFTADGKALLVGTISSQESSLLRVEFDGRVTSLRRSEQAGDWMGGMSPSRDGRFLAFAGVSVVPDVWLLENF